MSAAGRRRIVLRWQHVAVGLAVVVAVLVTLALLGRHGAGPPPTAVTAERVETTDDLPEKPVDFPKLPVTVFWAAADGSGLVPREEKIFATARLGDRVKQVAGLALAGPDPPEMDDVALVPLFPEGAHLRAVFVDAHGTAWLSLSENVRDQAPGGSAWELAAVYSIVNSVVRSFPEVRRVALLVEGHQVETLAGHLDLRQPLAYNDAVVRGT